MHGSRQHEQTCTLPVRLRAFLTGHSGLIRDSDHSFPYHGGPNNGAGCKFSGNGASTLPRHQPNPSIERSNLDCAFPPFPLTQPSRGASTDQHNKIAKSRTPTNLTFPEPSPLYSPLSPGTHGGENVLQRMNGIAPGPFAIRDRQSSDRPRPSTAASTTGLELPGTSHGGSSGQYRPATDGRSDESTSLPQWSASPNTMTTFDGARPSRPSQSRTDRLHGPGSAGRSITDPSDGHSSGTGFGHDRGKELPSKQNSLSNDSRPPIFADQRPTRPFRGLRPSSPIGPEGEAFNPRKPSDAVGLQSQNLTATPQTHARHTTFPRATLPKEDAKHDHQPKPIQTHETLPRAEEYAIGNPYHTSTPSQSSSGSGWGSDTRTRSSRSSPPASGSPDRLQRKWGGGESNAKSARVTKWPSQTELADRAPALQPPESPLDPAIKGGMFLKNPRHGPQSVTAAPESPVVSPRRPTKASRGDCRGCGEAIRGKSVSSADGRLTGRYHKQCKSSCSPPCRSCLTIPLGFVCKACQQPFDSATFYVLDNHPYCERDYHKLNNSLCQACDRGIEGQYLETERRQKYHPDCLTCQVRFSSIPPKSLC